MAIAVLALCKRKPEGWTGTATQLLKESEFLHGALKSDFPTDPRALSGQLNRAEMMLASRGVRIERYNENRERIIKISLISDSAKAA